MIRGLLVWMILLGVLIVGCNQISSPSSDQPLSNFETPSPLNTPRAIFTATSSPRSTATQPITPRALTSVTTPTLTAQRTTPPLTLKVTAPQDETIVNTAFLSVTGQTIFGAVLSVNAKLVNVDTSGKFATTIILDEGPNIIEIVASDDKGNEVSVILRVIYER